MRNHKPLTVYLDTQDFSRFGRVIQGTDKSGAAKIFEQLLKFAERGAAKFVYSMSTLSELLQYHPEHEQTSVAKARAVELLCRGNAAAGVVRVIAHEVARFAYDEGLLPQLRPFEVICSGDYWFPNLGNILANFRSTFEQSRQSSLQQFAHLNRHRRRVAEKTMSDRSFKHFAERAACTLGERYGVPDWDFSAAFGLYVRNRISGEDASRRLFSSIAKPTAFIQFYFRKYDGEKDFPQWMRSTGEAMQSAIEKMASELARFELKDVRQSHPRALESWRGRLASTIVGFAIDDGEEFGLTEDLIRFVQSHPKRSAIPSCGKTVDLIGEYVAQCIGLRGTKSAVEASFGGDLVHAMYIPYVDLWRGDRRFSKLVQDVGVWGNARIVPRLSELPGLIEKNC